MPRLEERMCKCMTKYALLLVMHSKRRRRIVSRDYCKAGLMIYMVILCSVALPGFSRVYSIFKHPY